VARTLALYDALLQADFSQPDARQVVEALEADMTESLATKQDLALLDQRFLTIDQRFAVIDHRFDAIDQRFAVLDHRFDAVDQQLRALDERMLERLAAQQREFDLKLGSLETRLVVKLGALMTGLLAAFTAVQGFVAA
jgi:hypothetical protein